MEPVYTPRGESSSSPMICVVRTLGAPVTDPQGKRASKISPGPTPSPSLAVTVEVICQTVSRASARHSRGTWTDPLAATRPRSFRSRSTIMMFSARSLALAVSSRASSSSSSSQRPRRRVPFMGRVSMLPPLSRAKNNSGEVETTTARPRSRKALKPALPWERRRSW